MGLLPPTTSFFVLLPMILLTVDGAIFHEVTCTRLEFDVVNFRFAARGTTHHAGCLFALAAHNYERRVVVVGCTLDYPRSPSFMVEGW